MITLKDKVLKKREELLPGSKAELIKEIERVKCVAKRKVEPIVKKKIEEVNNMIVGGLYYDNALVFTGDNNFKENYGGDMTWKASLFEKIPKRIIREVCSSNEIEIEIDNHYYRQTRDFIYEFQFGFYDINYSEFIVHEPDSSHCGTTISGALNKNLLKKYLKDEGLEVEPCKEGFVIKC